MSSTESQLRAALREGEGDAVDAVDAGVLIANANRVRRERRHRINTGLGIAAAATLIGGVGSVVIRMNHEESGAGGSAAAAPDAGSRHRAAPPRGSSAAGGSAGGSVRAPVAGGNAALPAPACPATPQRLAVPGGGGIGKFGSTDPLFSGPVAAITACGYPLSGKGARTVIVGTQARIVANSLETAPATSSAPPAISCPRPDSGTIELLPVDGRGRSLRPVIVTVACRPQATNGTAVRYPAKLPSTLTAALLRKPR